jgi:RES domain-containing protein
MLLWRISSHQNLDGGGGLHTSARWHTQGRRVVYLAEHPAAALLEVLVHLELDPENLPPAYKLLKIEAPANLSIQNLTDSDLPPGWRQDSTVTRRLGDEWLAARSSALLRVPSAVAPETLNYLLNPLHPRAAALKILSCRSYPWDERLIESRSR